MKRIISKLNIATILFLFILSGINQTTNAASPGSLDSSFGVAGTRTSIGLQGSDVAIQADGKIIVTGNTSSAPTNFRTARFTSTGVLDTTFGTNGFADVDFNGNDFAKSVSIQADGKIIIVGVDSTGLCHVIRYLPGGVRDLGFQEDVVAQFGMIDCRDSAIQLDGKIIVAGRSAQSDNSRLTLARLKTDGSLDTAFGTSGFAKTTSSAICNSVKIDPEGKLVAVGKTSPSSNNVSSLLISRFNSNGTLDNTFGGFGTILTDTGNSNEYFDVEIEPGGANSIFSTKSITAVGRATSSQGSSPIVHRFTNIGGFDTSFNGNGIVRNFTDNNSLRGSTVLHQSDGKIIVALVASTSGLKRIARFNPNGTLDSQFGVNGVLTTKENDLFNSSGCVNCGAQLIGNKLLTVQSFLGRLNSYNLTITPSQSGDFDGDGFGDIAVYRPSQGTWFILNSSDNSVVFKQFGLNGDIPIDGDFDGDGKNDLSIFRPSDGLWFVEKSSDGTNFARQFGISSDKPVTDDYDKDGKADLAFFRPASGEWFVLRSSDGFNSFFSFPFGANGDIPIVKKGP